MPEVVVVEGIYTLRPELIGAYDVTVWMQTSRATRIERQYSRGENSTFWIHRWMASEDCYTAKEPWKQIGFTVVGRVSPEAGCQSTSFETIRSLRESRSPTSDFSNAQGLIKSSSSQRGTK